MATAQLEGLSLSDIKSLYDERQKLIKDKLELRQSCLQQAQELKKEAEQLLGTTLDDPQLENILLSGLGEERNTGESEEPDPEDDDFTAIELSTDRAGRNGASRRSAPSTLPETTAEFIVHALRRNPEGLDINELLTEMKAAGWCSDANNPRHSIYRTMNKNKLTTKVGYKWVLNEFVKAPRPTRRRRRIPARGKRV